MGLYGIKVAEITTQQDVDYPMVLHPSRSIDKEKSPDEKEDEFYTAEWVSKRESHLAASVNYGPEKKKIGG